MPLMRQLLGAQQDLPPPILTKPHPHPHPAFAVALSPAQQPNRSPINIRLSNTIIMSVIGSILIGFVALLYFEKLIMGTSHTRRYRSIEQEIGIYETDQPKL
ncbi:TPA: hypothetical protein ACXNDR_005349 [Serratia marcescens]